MHHCYASFPCRSQQYDDDELYLCLQVPSHVYPHYLPPGEYGSGMHLPNHALAAASYGRMGPPMGHADDPVIPCECVDAHDLVVGCQAICQRLHWYAPVACLHSACANALVGWQQCSENQLGC